MFSCSTVCLKYRAQSDDVSQATSQPTLLYVRLGPVWYDRFIVYFQWASHINVCMSLLAWISNCSTVSSQLNLLDICYVFQIFMLVIRINWGILTFNKE